MLPTRFQWVYRYLKFGAFVLIALIVFMSGFYLGIVHQSNQSDYKAEKNDTTATSRVRIPVTVDTSGWETYKNVYHGYEISYPPGVDLRLSGVDWRSRDDREELRDRLSDPSIEWYTSTCIVLTDDTTLWLTISAAHSFSDVPCGPTGTSATAHIEFDPLIVNGQPEAARGFIEDDGRGWYALEVKFESQDYSIGIVYGVMGQAELNREDYSETLDLIHDILSTLKLENDFNPSRPPDTPLYRG